MLTIEAAPDATEIDLDGRVDASTGIRYIGKATRVFGGQWRCLAAVGNALCLVEVTVRPAVHVGADPGDEDDRGPRDARLERDLGQLSR
jgi:hypothetical protein